MRRYADEFDLPVVSETKMTSMRKVRHGAPVFDYTEVARKGAEAIKARVAQAGRDMQADIERRMSMIFPDRHPLEQSVITVHPVALQSKSVHEALTLLQVTERLEAMRGPATIQVGSDDTIMGSFRLPQFSYFGC